MLELNDYITTLNLISQTSEEDQANVTRFVSTLPKGFRTELSKAVEHADIEMYKEKKAKKEKKLKKELDFS